MRFGKRGIILIFLAAAMLLAGSMVFMHRVGLVLPRAQEEMTAHLAVLRTLEDFMSTLTDMETGQRGYLLTGEDKYLEPYKKGLSEIEGRVEELKRLAASGLLAEGDVNQVIALTREKLAELAQTIRLRREAGLDAALTIVRADKGQQEMEQIRAAIRPLLESQEAKFTQDSRRSGRANGVRTAAYLAAGCANLAFLGWMFARISGEMRRREAATAQLNEEKELLTTTLASIGDGVIATDASGRVTFINPEAERMTGWKTTEAAGRGLPEVFRIVDENSRQPAEDPVQKVLRSGKVVGLANHTVLIGKDRVEIPIDDSAAPVRLPGGPLLGVVLVFRDFTEQRAAEAVRARLAAIVESSGDAIVSKNLDGIIQTWNAGAQRMFGYQPEEIIGKPVTVLIPKDYIEEEANILARIRSGQPFERVETVRIAKDGRRIPVSLVVSPVKDREGRVIGASKILHDISEAVALRDALAREKEVLAATLASIGDAVIVADTQGHITFLNAEAERLTGWRNAEAAGHELAHIFRIINEQSREPVENPVEKVLRLGKVVGLANHTILVARNGVEVPIDDSAAPVRHSDGPLFGVVLVFRDFTERRRIEQDLDEAHRQLSAYAGQLEKAVEERTARLLEMIGELEHVSYAIVHDMRAPLRAMQAFAQILAEDSAEERPEVRADYARRIMAAASRLDKLIQDSLNYNKSVLKEMPLEPVDLGKLLRELVGTYPNLDSSKADIRLNSGLPVVVGNEALLTECFSNLLGNAVKFVASGTRPRVVVRSEINDGLARIWVEDNGIGIPRQGRERMFGLFQRLTNDYEGTGIGLAIVRKVVERMGGKVGCESEPGQGSRFWVDLKTAPDGISSRKE